MDDFIKTVSTTYFWLATVVVGIAINIISVRIDRLWPVLSTKWRERSTAAKEARKKRIEELRASTDLREKTWRNEVRLRFQCTTSFLMSGISAAIFVFTLTRFPAWSGARYWYVIFALLVLTYLITNLAVLVGVKAQLRAADLAKMLYESERKAP